MGGLLAFKTTVDVIRKAFAKRMNIKKKKKK